MNGTSAARSETLSVERNARTDFAREVRSYLTRTPRQLPSRYLYDALGSSLFEAICCLPWYPVTRAETRLLTGNAFDVFAGAGPLTHIVELGCGSGEKLATLVSGRPRSGTTLQLHLIDVSPAALDLSVRTLRGLPSVHVVTHQVSYEAGLRIVRTLRRPGDRTLVLCLGSNIGNFDPPRDEAFLRDIRASLGPRDALLIGADLVKPPCALTLAYDDPLGVTAAFNLNLLVRMNRELGSDFSLRAFAHRAVWNAAASRVEMHLTSRCRQRVRVDAAELEFMLEEGESIWTESSYKYEAVGVSALLARAGFSTLSQWIDRDDPFALTLAVPE